jgi:hypothetical protein
MVKLVIRSEYSYTTWKKYPLATLQHTKHHRFSDSYDNTFSAALIKRRLVAYVLSCYDSSIFGN